MCCIAKNVRRAPVAGQSLSTRAYKTPSWHYDKSFPAIGAYLKYFPIPDGGLMAGPEPSAVAF